MKVLQVFGEPLSFGGQEAFVMNIYECIDKSKVQFDFFTPFYCNNDVMKNRIEELGGKVYVSNKEFETSKRKLYYIQELQKFLKDHHYDIVHINSGSTFALAYGSEVAKKNGAKKVIVHSHSKGVMNLKYIIINYLARIKYKKNSDLYLACSDEAAKWKFPKTVIENQKYTVIKNGIQLDKYTLNDDIRKEYRKILNYSEEEIVLGHIGRMETEKNHLFILDVFKELVNLNEKSRLLLVGTGTLKGQIEEKIKEMNLEEKVTILEKRNDINNILQAMDVFIFPSLYEGLGIATIEAQSSGIKVFASENVPDDAKATENFVKIELSKGSKYWADEISKNIMVWGQRKDLTSQIREKGFDAKESAKKIEKIYIE